MDSSVPQEASSHLVRCLRLNPLWQSDEILESRAAALDIELEKGANYTEAQNQANEKANEKAGLREKLQDLRDKIWKAPLPSLQAQLVSLSLDNHPDLKQLGQRLSTIIKVRPQLPGLIDDKDFDHDFFDCFKKIITGTPRESAEIRERVLTSFRNRKLRKRGLKMIKLLHYKVSELTVYEESWLESLQRTKPQSRLVGTLRESTAVAGSGGGILENRWFWWILFIVGLRVVSMLVRNGNNG